MVTMLDCIKRVPSLMNQIVKRADNNFSKILETLDVKIINEICFIGLSSANKRFSAAFPKMEVIFESASSPSFAV